MLKGVWKEPPHPFYEIISQKISLFLRMMASLSEFFHIFFTVDILIRLWLKLLNPSTKVCHQTRLFHSAVASTANNVHKRASAARRVSFQINQQDCPQSFFLTWKQWNPDISVLVFLKAHADVNLITLNGCSPYTSLRLNCHILSITVS